MTATGVIETGVAVIGGGIAGLWTLAALRRAGHGCVLLERGGLGAGQTIWSQGIIHGGIKYALGGAGTEAAHAIARMPEVWSACLAGRGDVDLTGVRPLSPAQALWTTPGVVSRVAGAVASRAIRTDVRALAADERPVAFAGAPRGVDVYAVAEPVLPVAEVLRALASGHEGAIYSVDGVDAITAEGSGVMVRARRPGGESTTVRAGVLVLCAGAANADLAGLAGLPGAAGLMQRRPLHMVMARGPLPELFGHCLGPSTVPRLTVTTVEGAGSSERTWLVGGAIAESGVPRNEAEQVAAAAAELRACLPWLEWSGVRLATGRVDRAEGCTTTGARPDGAVVLRRGAVVLAWPTKLALAPVMAAEVVAALGAGGGTPRGPGPADRGGSRARPPGVSLPPWAVPGLRWHAA